MIKSVIMITSVLKAQSGMVLVFDENGEQIPQYQGQYEEVKEAICPYCHEAFIFEDADKIPPTCGRYECLRKAFMTPSKEVQRCS